MLMKSISSILIVLSFLAFNLKEGVLVSFYQLNKEYITKTYCVNKAKPELKCDGKCHLKKMLKKSKKTEQESFPEGTLEYKTITFLKSTFKLDVSERLISNHNNQTIFREGFIENQFVIKNIPSTTVVIQS